MTRNGMDISNYTQPLTPQQLDYVRDNLDWVCIGLQDARKARAFKAQLEPLGKQLMYYIERPGRDLSIPDPGAVVWVDIETGCFVERNETLQALADVEAYGFVPYVYGNKWSIQPVFGTSTELSRYPLSYADYRTPDLATFVAFNGFDKPFIWQFSSNGVAGINCDLCVSFDEERPMPTEPTKEEQYAALISLGQFIRMDYNRADLSERDKEVIAYMFNQIPGLPAYAGPV